MATTTTLLTALLAALLAVHCTAGEAIRDDKVSHLKACMDNEELVTAEVSAKADQCLYNVLTDLLVFQDQWASNGPNPIAAETAIDCCEKNKLPNSFMMCLVKWTQVELPLEIGMA